MSLRCGQHQTKLQQPAQIGKREPVTLISKHLGNINIPKTKEGQGEVRNKTSLELLYPVGVMLKYTSDKPQSFQICTVRTSTRCLAGRASISPLQLFLFLAAFSLSGTEPLHHFTPVFCHSHKQPLQKHHLALPQHHRGSHTAASKMDGDVFSKEVVRLWRAWKTVHEMVVDRVCRHSPPPSRAFVPTDLVVARYQL